MSKLGFIAFVALAMATLVAAPPAFANEPITTDPWLVSLSGDKQSMEEKIFQYILRVHGKTAAKHHSKKDPDDMYLSFSLSPKNAPKLTVYIDTMISGRSKTTRQVTEVAVKIVAIYKLPPSIKNSRVQRDKILRLNNDWMRRKWVPQRLVLNTRRDLVMESYFNIPHPNAPLHPEIIWDQLARMVGAWRVYYAEFKTTMGITGELQTPQSPQAPHTGGPSGGLPVEKGIFAE